jgi:hypothetical protein
MSINSDDLIGSFLNEQARLNSIADDGDVNNLVADLNGLADPLGTASDAIATSTGNPPHLWDDVVANHTQYGFFSWA